MNSPEVRPQLQARRVRIPSDGAMIEGVLEWPTQPVGVVLFAHGSGSSRLSPRNNFVASELRGVGVATLLMDLLTPVEDRQFANRFDIQRLVARVAAAAAWLASHSEDIDTAALPLCLFGASTGAAAALRFAAEQPARVRAVVSRGGRPDLAGETALMHVRAPTLLIVGGADTQVLALNKAAALYLMNCEKRLELIPGATHLFEEAGSLGEVAKLAAAWFIGHLAGDRPRG